MRNSEHHFGNPTMLRRRPRRRWEDNIKVDLKEGGWRGTEWIDLAQDKDRWLAVVKAVMNLRIP